MGSELYEPTIVHISFLISLNKYFFLPGKSSLLQLTAPQIKRCCAVNVSNLIRSQNECNFATLSKRALNSAVEPRYKRVKPKSTSLNECNFCALQLFLTERPISQGTPGSTHTFFYTNFCFPFNFVQMQVLSQVCGNFSGGKKVLKQITVLKI